MAELRGTKSAELCKRQGSFELRGVSVSCGGFEGTVQRNVKHIEEQNICGTLLCTRESVQWRVSRVIVMGAKVAPRNGSKKALRVFGVDLDFVIAHLIVDLLEETSRELALF